MIKWTDLFYLDAVYGPRLHLSSGFKKIHFPNENEPQIWFHAHILG